MTNGLSLLFLLDSQLFREKLDAGLGFSGFSVGTGFLREPKSLLKFSLVLATVFFDVSSVKPIISVTYHLNKT